MTNPFQVLNAASRTIDELRDVRVDRDREFSLSYEALVHKAHNVLLYGARGTGKTFLIRLLEHEIQSSNSSVFSCIVNVANLAAYNSTDEVAAFPKAVLLQLCTSLWTRLLGKSYIELRDRLNETGQELTLRKKDERTIQSVYSHLMLQKSVTRSSLSNTVGVTLAVKGVKNEQSSTESEHLPIMPFEIAEFADQLITDVLVPRGKTRVIVLCDESNHIKLYQQEQILEQYFELFSSKHLQFLFVAGIAPWSEKDYIPSCFETTFELKGFAERIHVQELIEAALTANKSTIIQFSPVVIDVLFETFSGHPRKTLYACEKAFAAASGAGHENVDLHLILRACREVEDEDRIYNLMRSRVLQDG